MVFTWSPDDNVALKVPKCFGVNKKRRNASVEMLPKNISQTNTLCSNWNRTKSEQQTHKNLGLCVLETSEPDPL